MRERSVLVVMAALIVGGCEGLLGDSAAGPRGGPGGPVDPNDPGAPINPGQPLVCEEEPPGRRVLRLLTRDEYRATVADLLGIAEPNVDAFPVESAVRGYDNEANAQLVTGRHIDAYLDASAQVAAGVDPLRFVDCDVSAADCQRRFVERFGQRAFRRPLASDEVDRFTALFATQLTQGDARVGARLVVEAMLAAPSFLYRSEVGELQSDGTYALTSWEVASALSYLFWGTMPDDALFALAESDSLRDPSAVEREARRLLEDERSEPSIAAFVGRWLGTVRLLGTNRDASLFPGFSNAVRESMLAEEREFVRHVMFEGSGEFHELFDADYLLVDGNLRSYYGLGDGGSATFERVAAPAERRGGLLVMGSVMATHAHSNESSPIRRGLFVRDRLLCHDLPPPPANVDATPPGLDPTLTTRERFARHTSDASCAACHQFIDGVGFPFERFDAVGAYRETENGLEIDTSGQLIGSETLSDGMTLELSGPQDLAAHIAQSDSARDCMARQWWRWSRGTIERDRGDACSVQTLARRFEETSGNLRELMVAVVTQRSFLVRRAGEVSP